jgi:hypothetical protein
LNISLTKINDIPNKRENSQQRKNQMEPLRRFQTIAKAIHTNYYNDLGCIELLENSTLETMRIKVIPHEGIHKNVEYTITCEFQEVNNWPFIFIDSEIYDKIKTSQYLQHRGRTGTHKGICIKYLGYAYGFSKNFKNYCDNKWENYIYYLITVFNNLQDFEKGNGLKSNYKTILSITPQITSQ